MNIFINIYHKCIRWLEKRNGRFHEFQNMRRYKKWDTAPCVFGINSYTNPHVYQFLINLRNERALSDFDLANILALFTFEQFTVVGEMELIDFLAMHRLFTREHPELINEQILELSKHDPQKYFFTLLSLKLLQSICEVRRRKSNGQDSNRAIRRLYCELRILLMSHIVDQGEIK